MTKEDFIKEVEKRFNLKLEISSDIKGSRAVYKIKGTEVNNESYFYIKESKKGKPFWGFTNTIIGRLDKAKCSYFLVLLSNENNYCFSSDKVIELCQKLSYSEDGDFKLTLSYLGDYDNCKLDFDILFDQIKNSTEIIGKKEKNIMDKCQVVSDIVNAFKTKYCNYSETAQAFLETTIGAAIFYVYNLNDDQWWEEKVIVSEAALKAKEFCPDHIVPRKKASSLLLDKASKKELTKDDIYNLLVEKFCKIIYLTKKENASYKDKKIEGKDLENLFSFDTLKKMYKEHKEPIELTKIEKEDFDKKRKPKKSNKKKT